MHLFIDTSNNTRISLQVGEHKQVIEYDSPRNQDVLLALYQFLEDKHIDLQDLTAIQVIQGPGHFTSLRTGIAIAQSLSLALEIPINSHPPGTTIEALYGKPPSISQPKKGE